MSEIHVELQARETHWTIAPDRSFPAWGYEGTIPGPTIVGHVGDVAVARLVNHLPEPTSIHWHGLRLPAAMDGTSAVQRMVEPGESFEYRFELLDAGTFWYHSHANETVQMEKGLYGALVVLGADEPVFDADRLLVLDDVKLDGQDRIAKTALFDRHTGREGSVLVINGRTQPDYAIAAGQVERWRVVNACSARYVRLSLGGRPFRLIGSDGGLRDHEITVTETLLTPGERVELAVGPFEDEGAVIAIESLPYRRTAMKRPRRDRWATLHVTARARSVVSRRPAQEAPPALATIVPLVPAGPVTPTRVVRLGARMTFHGHDWLINDELHYEDAPVRWASSRSGSSSTRRGWTTRSTCTASSSRWSRSTVCRWFPRSGRTPSTWWGSGA